MRQEQAELAQSVERTTLNRVVVGSIPTFGASFYFAFGIGVPLLRSLPTAFLTRYSLVVFRTSTSLASTESVVVVVLYILGSSGHGIRLLREGEALDLNHSLFHSSCVGFHSENWRTNIHLFHLDSEQNSTQIILRSQFSNYFYLRHYLLIKSQMPGNVDGKISICDMMQMGRVAYV